MKRTNLRFGFAMMTVLLLASGFTAIRAQQAQTEDPLAVVAATIKADELCDTLQFFSHRGMAGRGTIDGGSEFPSLFLRRELRRLGYAPKGDLISATMTNRDVTENISFFQSFMWNERIPSRNILGVIEGEKKDEWVILGAHYDHEGTRDRIDPGTLEVKKAIYFGADDNGSGTVATLAVAEVFAKLAQKGIRPKRSILICFWGAEEVGEIGSKYFSDHLPKGMDKEKIAAYINMDMVGRNDPKELFVLCAPVPDKKPGELRQTEAPPGPCEELYGIAERVNEALKLEFVISHKDTVTGFERTDGWSVYQIPLNNARRIPVWELHTGEHKDYHKPTDTWDKINYPKLARVAKLAFGIAWQVSQMNGVPSYK